MQQASLEDIRQKAQDCYSRGEKWHFHIMSPTCVFNKSDSFAFILELPENKEAYVHYSLQAEKKLGQMLAPLLHGSKILSLESAEENYSPALNVQRIIERARQLNDKGTPWHHHLLFPDCIFNLNGQKYALIFEDPESGKSLESLTDNEPTNDLKQIESLFYE